jgi:hypothetical protein
MSPRNAEAPGDGRYYIRGNTEIRGGFSRFTAPGDSASFAGSERTPFMKQTNPAKDELPSESAASTPGGDPALPNRPAAAPVTKDDVARQVDANRQQELEMQRQLEEMQRERNELQELRRKQEECDLGRKEMLERITRSLVLLEHAHVETERRLDHIQNARGSFRTLKDQLESIRDDQWNNANLKAELTKALAVVDSARNEFNHYRARLEVLDEKRNPEAAAVTGPLAEFAPGESWLTKIKFGDLVKLGLALSLPLIVAAAILALVLLVTR